MELGIPASGSYLEPKSQEAVVAEFELMNKDEEPNLCIPETVQPKQKFRTGLSLLYHQFRGLLIKRARYSTRKWGLILVQVQLVIRSI